MDVKIAAATADVITAPVQLPAFALAKLGQPHRDPKAAAERSEAERKHDEERLAAAKEILNALKTNPALLTDDTFWARQPTRDYISSMGLDWFLQDPNAPRSPAINAYLLGRFPEQAGMILANGRATQSELTGLAGDREQAYKTRESALDTLLRDDSFEFGEPWRRMVIDEFTSKVTLLFGTRRFTRNELQQLSQDPQTPKWIRDMATDQITRNWFKPEPGAPAADLSLPTHQQG